MSKIVIIIAEYIYCPEGVMVEISLVMKFHECLQSNIDQTRSTFLRKESDIIEILPPLTDSIGIDRK